MIKRLSLWLAHPYLRILILLAIFILPATVMRLGLYVVYPDDFSGLSFRQVLLAFLVGFRFDISIAVMMIGIPVLLMLLPFRWSHHRYWQYAWGAFIFVAWILFILLMVMDTIYFGQVHRHIGSEVNTLSNDVGSIVSIAVMEYKTALLLFALATSMGAWLWWHLLRPIPAHPHSPWLRLLMLPLLFLLLLIAGRGGYTGKPMGVGEAFFSDSLAQGYLTMNGAFAISHELIEKQPPVKSFMPQAQADAMVQAQLASPNVHFTNPEYPLARIVSGDARKKKPNVVVLMLESWGGVAHRRGAPRDEITAPRGDPEFRPAGEARPPLYAFLCQWAALHPRCGGDTGEPTHFAVYAIARFGHGAESIELHR